MKSTKSTSKFIITAMIAVVGLGAYLLMLFVIGGIDGHGTTYWMSFGFMMAAFLSLGLSSMCLRRREVQPRDWLLGYPVLRHCILYLVLELIASIIFMVLDESCPWQVALLVQTVMLAIHLIFVFSCFLAKAMIDEVREGVSVSTSFMKTLRVEVESVVDRAGDPAVKEAFSKLAEQVRFSDPVSSAHTEEIEDNLQAMIKTGGMYATSGNNAAALQCVKEAELLLAQRNRLCKATK